MEFADGSCYLCGEEFGEKTPKEVTKVKKPYVTPGGRSVDFVAPCPSCGENVPLWDPGEPDAEPEPEPEPEPTE